MRFRHRLFRAMQTKCFHPLHEYQSCSKGLLLLIRQLQLFMTFTSTCSPTYTFSPPMTQPWPFHATNPQHSTLFAWLNSIIRLPLATEIRAVSWDALKVRTEKCTRSRVLIYSQSWKLCLILPALVRLCRQCKRDVQFS